MNLNSLFLIQVYLGFKFCPSVLEIVGLRVLLGIPENVLCSMPALLVKIVLLLDAVQPLMLFVGTFDLFGTKAASLTHSL
jgi:hypothetical protein